jgi:hypothetical protein
MTKDNANRLKLGVAILCIALALGTLPSIYLIGSGNPVPVFENGRIVEIQNCESPTAENMLRCAGLICEKELYARSLLPPGVKIVEWNRQHHFSDDPDRSIHTAKYADQSKFRYAACEMSELRVVSANEIIH